ncbi:cathelicidin-related peptide Oh-Cath-like [Trachemys scripta elegans]|uniref:cathelicidin-related peptide Oh-Cath-like n=1 Tax=Trachemys scripta elegans TaxID=31138 RepID=UPI001556CBDD|nr:cathelicidin-related peptide Oh-Cath-like [Trachemys scripta elegans]
METCLKDLLLVGVVTAAPAPSSAPLPTHEDAVLAAVQVYNQEPGTTLAYRLLEAEPQPDWDVSSKTIQPVKFTVQETVCLVSGKRDISQCEFKEDGLVKDCSGFFSTEQDPPSVIIKCEEASEEVSGLDGLLSAHGWAEAGLRVSLTEIPARYFTLHKCPQNMCLAPPTGSELAKVSCPTSLEIEPYSCQQNRREQILISRGYVTNLKLHTVEYRSRRESDWRPS